MAFVKNYDEFLLESELKNYLALSIEESSLASSISNLKSWVTRIENSSQAMHVINMLKDALPGKSFSYKKTILQSIIPIILGIGVINAPAIKDAFKQGDSETSAIVHDIAHEKTPEVNIFDTYKKHAEAYLKNEYPKSPITADMLTASAKKTYDSTGVIVPLDLALAQGELESQLGTDRKHRNPRTNPFSVGEYDNRTAMRFQNTAQGVQAYYDLMAKDYLKYKSKGQLINNFVNGKGMRYASDPRYETKLHNKVKYVNNLIKNLTSRT